MSLLQYHGDEARIEGVSLTDIARRYGTPCYVYSRAALDAAYSDYRNALADRDALICYAVKANPNLAILDLFARLGAGFDIVSAGELARVLAIGGDPDKVMFSGVGKTRDEMRAALQAGIHCFNVESASELLQLEAVAAAMNLRAPVALRVNPDIAANTHPYISTGLRENKFGVAAESALDLYLRAKASPHLRVVGVDCHIGSQLLDAQPAADAADKILLLVDQLAAAGVHLRHINLGGGKGVRYHADDKAPSATAYLAPLLRRLQGRREKLVVEPGRSLVAEAGLLLSRVLLLKPGERKNFAVVDAAMNDLSRPALYDAWHDMVAISAGAAPGQRRQWDIVGPICESGDFLGRGRDLDLAEDDLVAILCAGAYGMSMSSNYNSRPRAAEVLVEGAHSRLIRRRESVSDLFAAESFPPPEAGAAAT